MAKFDRLISIATKLASDNGVTIQELLRDDRGFCKSRQVA